MRMSSVVAVTLMLLTGCNGPTGRTQPNAITTITTSPSRPAVSMTPAPSPQPAAPQSTKPVVTGGTPKTSKPGAPPPSGAVAGISGELTLDAPPDCWWVPKAFLNGDGGISVRINVLSWAVTRSTDIGITVVGGIGERGQITISLPQGDGRQRPSVIANAGAGSYQAHLTVSLDPKHRVLQAKGYDDDVATIRVEIPFPRPATASDLNCYMVR